MLFRSTKHGIVTVTTVPITTMDKGKFVTQIHFKVGNKQFAKLSGVVKLLGLNESINEASQNILVYNVDDTSVKKFLNN